MWGAGHHSDSLLKEVPADWLLREDLKPLGRDEEEAVDKDERLGSFASVLGPPPFFPPPAGLQEKPQASHSAEQPVWAHAKSVPTPRVTSNISP